MKLPSVLVLAALAHAACKPAPVVYPDAAKLASSQTAWCNALGKHERPEEQGWRHAAACAAATPTGSAPFVAQMAQCYAKHHEDRGAEALDLGGVVSTCADEILGAAEPGDVASSEPIRARCARMARCEKVSEEICKGVFDQLAPMQKVALTSAYSLAAQHAIATCLDETACSPDEDAARNGCYRDAERQRVWMPPM